MKKLIFMMLFIFIFTLNAFSQKGYFSLGQIIPIGLSYTMYSIADNHKSQLGFEVSWLLIQTGYNFIINNNQENVIFLGMDLGWATDTYAYKNSNNENAECVFDSFNIGAYLEARLKYFMIGLGGGIKIPIAGSYRYDFNNANHDYLIEMLNYNHLKSRFDNLYIPYIKTVIGLTKNWDKWRGSIAFYLNYDFSSIAIKNYNSKINKMSAIDFGLQISYYYDFF